jgi:hypothetical protein
MNRLHLPRRASWLIFGSLAACASLSSLLLGKTDEIRIPHARHAQADIDCLTCHETIFDSTTLETSNLPKEQKCLGCHKEQKNDCAFCHTQPDKPHTYAKRDPPVKMNHQAHLERVKEDCTVCHKELPNPFVTADVAPPMQACNSCHEHNAQFAKGDCQACHKDLGRYALEPVVAFSHQGDYVKRHRLDARAGDQTCAQCHEQSFCSDCHASTVSRPIEVKLSERVDLNFIHRNDFEGRHSIEARADQAMCQRCHGTTFCQDCHTRRGLSPLASTSQNPHPFGFNDSNSASFHGVAARRDIASCAACHDQGAASNCVDCHKVGAVGGNPHPPSWLVRHRREEVSANAMCQICHL